jgi:predicted unusual protein kinase regulating ubiquinone biosynthesis (AarF/ABC1/UbiB family)
MASGDEEASSLAGRLARYARVGAGVGGVAARMVGARALGRDADLGIEAADVARMLGGLKGPLMKVAQLAATVPDLLPPEYAFELQKLQSMAPPMGWAFVRRRMNAELGLDWQKRFKSFEHEPSAAASLGQVHRAVAPDSRAVACKLQYPNMESAVEADLRQLSVIMAVQRRFTPEIDSREILKELSERLPEELDYEREARHMRLYGEILSSLPDIHVPEALSELSTRRLLTMTWLEGKPLLSFVDHPLEDRNRIATALFRAWWRPFAHYGVIHGDPHLGNYTIFEKEGRVAGLNLLDYGCIRIFSPRFVNGVIELYRGFQTGNRERISAAYAIWGFPNLNDDMIDTLSVWARFIYGPLLDDRIRTVADGVAPHLYGRREVWEVKQSLKEKSPLTIPREFVLMNRAAVGLGAVFLHLKAEMNFHQLFEAEIEGFELSTLTMRQRAGLESAGLVGRGDV